MEKRTNKEYRVSASGQCKTRIGTVNKNNPVVVYIVSEGWVTPLGEKRPFGEDIARVESIVRDKVAELAVKSPLFTPKTLLTFSVKTDRMKVGKPSSICVEAFFKQNCENGTLSMPKLKAPVSEMAESMTKTLSEALDDYGYSVAPARETQKE